MKFGYSLITTVGGFLLATSASASTFYIDEFSVTKNGNSTWFVDSFNDGIVPPSSESTFPNGTPASYSTLPSTMPGPEQGGKLALDTSLGQPVTSSVTGTPLLMQRARLLTNTSNDPVDLNRGLKTDDTFTVAAIFDLLPPEIQGERYGIRLTDFGTAGPNDNVQLSVVRDESNTLMVTFREADFSAGQFNLLDSYTLSASDFSIFEQIVLNLSKLDANSNGITASFQLIDLDNASNSQQFGINGNPMLFDGELWTRAEFFTAQVVPLPATLPLFVSALGLLGFAGWRQGAA